MSRQEKPENRQLPWRDWWIEDVLADLCARCKEQAKLEGIIDDFNSVWYGLGPDFYTQPAETGGRGAYQPATPEALAREARRWDSGDVDTKGWRKV